MQLSRREEERLRALEELHVLDTPPEERFDRVTRLSQRLFGVPMAWVNLIGRETTTMKSGAGIEPGEHPREVTFCTHALDTDDGLVVEDATQDPRFAANPFVTGDPYMRFYAGVPLEAPGGQRVGTLCIADTQPRALSDADRAVLRDLALWVEKELGIDEELERAAEVQRAMFPTRPVEDPAWDVAGACRPARDVGGDFYDWHRTPAGTGVSLGDVMGKGMPAAIVMASVRAALRAGARRPDLAEGLEDAAASLTDELEATASFTTAVLCRLAPDGEVTAVDAGHGHAAIVRADGTCEPLRERGLPIGIDVGERYVAETHRLAPGDALVLHSDGLLELPDGPRATADVAALVTGAQDAADAVGRALAPTDGHPLPDDVTVLVARRKA